MPAMNPKSFVRLMKLLDLAAIDIAQSLYVSPSHVSRWKTGSRELKTSSPYFQQLEDLFLWVNAQQGERRLEQFLLSDTAEDQKDLIRQRLRQFLIQPGAELTPFLTPPFRLWQAWKAELRHSDSFSSMC